MGEAIGGYFGLELSESKNLLFNNDMIALNSARNCLEYILITRKYKLLYIPYFTCSVLLEPLKKLGISYEFYDVDDNLEPIFNYSFIDENKGFLYTNYFGIKDQFITRVANKIPNLIIDNAQSLFSSPLERIDTFYSPRKFLGVADGGFLSINEKLIKDFDRDLSFDRMSHLLKRIDISPEYGYQDFCVNDQSLENQPIKLMSNLTCKIFSGIDQDFVRKRRKENFNFLHDVLEEKNILNINIHDHSIPMIYPFRTKDLTLKKKLISEKIYCATYWPNVFEWAEKDKNSYILAEEIIALPIDQRYSIKEMEEILKHV